MVVSCSASAGRYLDGDTPMMSLLQVTASVLHVLVVTAVLVWHLVLVLAPPAWALLRQLLPRVWAAGQQVLHVILPSLR